jgi:LmbE family N-acetylglucosaminyl deacetylase
VLLGYEVWTPLSEYNEVQDISAVMERKLEAVRCHRSQMGEYHYERAVRGLNEYRGVMAGRCRYAEVFRRLDLFSSTE